MKKREKEERDEGRRELSVTNRKGRKRRKQKRSFSATNRNGAFRDKEKRKQEKKEETEHLMKNRKGRGESRNGAEQQHALTFKLRGTTSFHQKGCESSWWLRFRLISPTTVIKFSM